MIRTFLLEMMFMIRVAANIYLGTRHVIPSAVWVLTHPVLINNKSKVSGCHCFPL